MSAGGGSESGAEGGGGGGNDQQIELLRNIWNEMKGLRASFETQIAGLRAEMHDGFETLGRRIDNVLLGEHQREHVDLRGRVERIELRVGVRPPRRRRDH